MSTRTTNAVPSVRTDRDTSPGAILQARSRRPRSHPARWHFLSSAPRSRRSSPRHRTTAPGRNPQRLIPLSRTPRPATGTNVPLRRLSGVEWGAVLLLAPEPRCTVRRLKETSGSDLSIGGAGIAAEAFRHGLVDECVLLLCPVLVGGGKPALPRGVRLNLELLDQRRFANGVIYVRHAVRNPA